VVPSNRKPRSPWTGARNFEVTVDHPDTPSASGGGTEYAHQVTEQIKEAAVRAIETLPDISTEDFVEEARARELEDRGEELTSSQKQARRERYQRALAAAKEAESHPVVDKRDALERARDERDAADDPRFAPQESDAEDPRFQPRPEDFADQQRARDAMVAETAKYELRAQAFEQVAPDYKEVIQGTFGVFPPQESVAAALLASPVGPELAYRLAQDLDAIEELNQLPPAQAAQRIARAEGMLMAMHDQRAAAPPPRRTTKAPPPMKSVRGGAGPGFNPTTSNDMTAFAGWLKKDLAKRQGR
jgi:hypothetical protein